MFLVLTTSSHLVPFRYSSAYSVFQVSFLIKQSKVINLRFSSFTTYFLVRERALDLLCLVFVVCFVQVSTLGFLVLVLRFLYLFESVDLILFLIDGRSQAN